jgi:hypothetical protein
MEAAAGIYDVEYVASRGNSASVVLSNGRTAWCSDAQALAIGTSVDNGEAVTVQVDDRATITSVISGL